MKYGHLTTFNCTLTTLSPLFIGDGKAVTKREYYLDALTKKIGMVDLPRFSTYLIENNLLDAYERYLLSEKNKSLADFCREHNIDIQPYIQYWIDAGIALQDAKFSEVNLFTKDASTKQPYIPGSSIKGAIRTAICATKIVQKQRKATEYEKVKDIENSLLSIVDVEKGNAATRDLLKGLQISDSEPVPYDALTLCDKEDRFRDGITNKLNVYRECIIPRTKIRFVITIDHNLLTKYGLDIKQLGEALEQFDEQCYDSFTSKFDERENDANMAVWKGYPITIGGGCGYVYKTFSYPLYREKAVSFVTNQMMRKFKNGKHQNDEKIGISPHTDKKTVYKDEFYPMGRCELAIAEE